MRAADGATMDRDTFSGDFDEASQAALSFARRVTQAVYPESVRFHLDEIEMRTPRKPTPADKIKFLGGGLLAREALRCVTLAKAIKLPWVDGKRSTR